MYKTVFLIHKAEKMLKFGFSTFPSVFSKQTQYNFQLATPFQSRGNVFISHAEYNHRTVRYDLVINCQRNIIAASFLANV